MDTVIQVSGKGLTGAGKGVGTAMSVDKTGSGEGVHTLTDLTVHEVSSVDVPANKRRWLIIKNAQGQIVERREIAAAAIGFDDVLIPAGRGAFKHAVPSTPTPPAAAASEQENLPDPDPEAEATKKSEPESGTSTQAEAAAEVVQDSAAPASNETLESSPDAAAEIAAAGESPAQPADETLAQEQAQVTEKNESAQIAASVAAPETQAAPASAPEVVADPATETAPTQTVAAKVETPATVPVVEAPAPAVAKVETPATETHVSSAAEIEIDEKTAGILSGAAGVMKAGRKLSAERKARLSRIADELAAFLAELEDKAAAEEESAKALKAMEASLAQRDKAIEALTAATDALKAQVEELRATSKGTGVVVPTEKQAPPVSGQFEVRARAEKPAAVSWSELQTNLNKRKR